MGLGKNGNPEAKFYTSLRLKLHWLDWGNPGAPVLILQHGGMDHCRSWDHIAREFAQAYHVIAPDLRGHGESAWSSDGNYTVASHVYDFAELIRVNGWSNVRVVAHSLGGNVAARFAGIYPGVVEKLVLVEGLGYPPAARKMLRKQSPGQRLRGWIEMERDLAKRQPRNLASVEDAIARMRKAHPELSAETAAYVTTHGVRRNEDDSYAWKYDPYVRMLFPDLTEIELAQIWAEIDCPVLLIRGANSWETDPLRDGRFAHFRNARAVEIAGASHDVHHHQPDKLVAAIREFFT